MKFLNQDRFYAEVNQWVRDGSNITGVISAPWGDRVELIGKDGAKEGLSYYFERGVEFNHDDTPWGDAPKSGDRIVVQNTLLYNGRVGILLEIPDEDQLGNLASWDYHVKLDDRVIGVDADQVRLPNKEE
jgi:hypothetical protein